MKIHQASPEHEACFQAIVVALRPFADKMTAIEVLAILANMVGKAITWQDQRKYTSEQILKLVEDNIFFGNQQALAAAIAMKPLGST